ncbi:helix-turn-helix domain-containing protein [Paenibacillus allorhizosphaerae]|uniref:Melibiose operon regulatory protein n=1 Tax=Paenibacillus allorhizosphaerae TaxID=2849866 RepID=A0ABN7TTA9_9BACL|nr:AraC family transcriptional regulator [Paenibacillus allorhizosphaerae]CAG7654313.1 Melibiose operon regulatory protein [Paenibacillus allorhizosphaerae]
MKLPLPYSLFGEYYYNWPKKKKFSFHSHALYEIFYLHSGKGDFWLGDRRISLHPGDLIIMDGLTPHGPKVYADDEYVRSMFQLDPSIIRYFDKQLHGLNPLLPFEQLIHCRIRLTDEYRAEFEDMLLRLNRLYVRQDLISSSRFLMAFYDMLMFIYGRCEHLLGSTAIQASERERSVRKIVSFIEHSYAEEITLDRLEKQVYLSKQYLSKIFREATGMTIIDFLHSRRINHAKLLFSLEQASSVTDVCYEVGFKNLSHFSRLFKEQEGISPERFKKLTHQAKESN